MLIFVQCKGTKYTIVLSSVMLVSIIPHGFISCVLLARVSTIRGHLVSELPWADQVEAVQVLGSRYAVEGHPLCYGFPDPGHVVHELVGHRL